jgi:hypothetical protein
MYSNDVKLSALRLNSELASQIQTLIRNIQHGTGTLKMTVLPISNLQQEDGTF